MNLRNVSRAPRFVGRRAGRHRRRRHGAHRRAVDRRRLPRRARPVRRRRTSRSSCAAAPPTRWAAALDSGRRRASSRTRSRRRARRRRRDRFPGAVRDRRRAAEAHRDGGERAVARRRAAGAEAAAGTSASSRAATFTPGTFEVIVGRGASRAVRRAHGRQQAALGHDGLDRRRHLRGPRQRRGVGDLDRRHGAAGRLQPRHAPTSRCASGSRAPSAFQSFKDTLTTDPRLNVRVFTEKAVLRGAVAARCRRWCSTIGVTIAVLMGLGAVFAALNTMYSAVSARTREIATLRALGFGSHAGRRSRCSSRRC